jgi:hypothetical protein
MSTFVGCGVKLTVTVRPLCGRAASAAAIAADIGDADVVDRPHAASVNPPAIPAAMKPRLLRRVVSGELPLVGRTGIDRSLVWSIRHGGSQALSTLLRYQADRNPSASSMPADHSLQRVSNVTSVTQSGH